MSSAPSALPNAIDLGRQPDLEDVEVKDDDVEEVPDEDDIDRAPPILAGPPLVPPRRMPGGAGGEEEAPAAASEANGRGPDRDDQGSDMDGINDDVVRTDDTVDIKVYGFREAVNRLEGVDERDRRPIRLVVFGREHGDDELESDHRNAFRRFVDVLGQPPEGGGGTVRAIDLWTDWSGLPDEDMERLFGQVLPAHRTLQRISIYSDRIPTRFFRRVMDSIPAANVTSLSDLHLHLWGSDPPTDREQVQAIGDMLKRNAGITNLFLFAELEDDQCKLLGQALHGNTNLRDLELVRVKLASADALDGFATSSLQSLRVHGSVSDDAVSSLARRLRTNETLQELRLDAWGGNSGIRGCHALLDLVKTYNYALHRNLGSYHEDARVREQFKKYMRRNAWIRDALEEPHPYASLGVPERLLPRFLGQVSDLPTALYRVLRMGYVNAVSDRLVAAAAKGATASATTTTTATAQASESSWRRSPPLAKRRRILGGSGEETGNPSAM